MVLFVFGKKTYSQVIGEFCDIKEWKLGTHHRETTVKKTTIHVFFMIWTQNKWITLIQYKLKLSIALPALLDFFFARLLSVPYKCCLIDRH